MPFAVPSVRTSTAAVVEAVPVDTTVHSSTMDSVVPAQWTHTAHALAIRAPVSLWRVHTVWRTPCGAHRVAQVPAMESVVDSSTRDEWSAAKEKEAGGASSSSTVPSLLETEMADVTHI
jgi:hypothetical protein